MINAHAGARFLTRALEIKVQSVFEVFFSEIRHTLGSVRHQRGITIKGWVILIGYKHHHLVNTHVDHNMVFQLSKNRQQRS